MRSFLQEHYKSLFVEKLEHNTTSTDDTRDRTRWEEYSLYVNPDQIAHLTNHA